MAAIEIHINNQKYVIKGDTESERLGEVVDAVQEKIDSLLRSQPSMTPIKAALLAAVEFSDQTFEVRSKFEAYRHGVLDKAGAILERIERDLTPPTN